MENGEIQVRVIHPEDHESVKEEIEHPVEDQEEEEQEDEEGGENTKDQSLTPDNPKEKANETGPQYDCTEVYNQVFGDRTEFDSWDAFTDYLEEFQTKSGTLYKPRSACRVDHVNERRTGSAIPDRFVYAAVKMICVHYGDGGSGKRKNYVGKGCQAYMRVSYSKGAMRVTHKHLIHSNHELIYEANHPATRNFRVFNFTEELDLEIVREVLRANPFQYKNGEKEWLLAVDVLKDGDERFATITPRLIKKRTRLLLDNFSSIRGGRKPPEEDEMGTMLYKLDLAKKNLNDEASTVPRTGKRRSRGRPPKVAVSEDTMDYLDNIDDDDDEDYVVPTRSKRQKLSKSAVSQSPSPTKSMSNGDISTLLSHMQRKDEEDRKLRTKQLEEDRKQRQRDAEEQRRLMQREIDLRRDELSFQKQRFEFEKSERQVLMDLLKSQLQVFEQSMQSQSQAPQQHQVVVAAQPPSQQQVVVTAQPQQAQTILPITITQQAQQPPQQAQATLQQSQVSDSRAQGAEYTQYQYR